MRRVSGVCAYAAAGLLLVALSGAWGCRSLSGRVTSPLADVVQDALGDLPGVSHDHVEVFEGEQLYDYMNGAAVTYLERDFRRMIACDVYEQSVQAKVELFEMGAAQSAGAVFSELSSAGGEPLAVGEGGRYWSGGESEGVFLRGAFIVRILVYAEEATTAAALTKKVAAALDRGVGLYVSGAAAK